jgi:hypothetical protein
MMIKKMTFSIAKPFIAILAFALNYIFNIMDSAINTSMRRQLIKVKRR